MQQQIITTKQRKDIEVANIVKDTAAKIADAKNAIAQLTPEQLQALQNSVLLDSLKNEFKTIVNIAGIDLENEKQKFLMQFKSTHTRTSYAKPIERLEEYARKIDKNILELNYADADDFILDLQNDCNNIYSKRPRGIESIRLDIAGVSSFYTFLERRHSSIKNPFRGTRARPKKSTSTKQREKYDNITDWQNDIDTIIKELPPHLATAVYIMAYRGLRIGALPNLFITDNRFITDTKGKEQRGEFSNDILKFIAKSGLNRKRPFDYLNKEYAIRLEQKAKSTDPEQCLKMQLNRRIKKLYEQGKITRLFTPHEFRHFYAVSEYSKDKDIHRLSKLLNHASIQITEIYLKGLNIID